jgi:hypothetical protein
MLTLTKAKNGVSRSLADGWDYLPDWRSCQIEEYLAELVKAKDRKDALQQILFRESDPVVRQGLRFRMTGTCAATSAFSWAVRCARDNPRTGVLSMIKAMAVGGLPTAFIARELATVPLNIVVTERIYFDVRRYTQNRMWLRSAIIDPQQDGLPSVEQLRERAWLGVAFEATPERLLAVLQGGEDASNETLEETSQKIEAAAGKRALSYVRDLDRSGRVATEDDLRRYVLARGMRSREAAVSASDQVNKFKEWGLSVVTAFEARCKEDLDEKTLRNVAQVLPLDRMKQIKDEVREQAEQRALLANSGEGLNPSGEVQPPTTAAP